MAKSDNSDIAVLQDWRNGVDKTLERIEAKIDNLDKKFAARWVQTVVGAMVGAILLGFIGVVIAFFIPQKTPATPTAQTPTTTAASPSGTAGTPTAQATSNATATPANPTATDSQSSGGGITIPLPHL